MSNKDLGKLIGKLRKKKNMTQSDLANILNVTNRAISNWETGKNYPDIDIIKELSRVLEYDFFNNFYNSKKKSQKLTNYLEIFIILILVIFFFLLLFFFTNYQNFKVYSISSEEINLGNSVLVITKDSIILDIDKVSLPEANTIENYSLNLKNSNLEEEIVYKDNNNNLTLIDSISNPIYFPKDFLKNKDNLIITITYQENNELKTKDYHLTLTKIEDSIKKLEAEEKITSRENTKILLKNNGYTLPYKNYYIKEITNLKLIYDLNTNTFSYYETINDLDYELTYLVKENNIILKTYYNNNSKVLVMEATLNPKTNNITCNLGDCTNIKSIYTKMCNEYNKISDSSLTGL